MARMETGVPEVVVPMQAAAAAARVAAGPAAAGAGAAARVAAGPAVAAARAAAPPAAGAGAAARAAAGPAAAARAAAQPPRHAVGRVIVTWAGAAGAGGAPHRVAWAVALFVLGCAAAGLALFAMMLPVADSRLLELGDLACTRTQNDVLALRTASQTLFLAATMAILMPARLVAVFGYIVGWIFTADPATDVLWYLVNCHERTVQDDLNFAYRFVRYLLYTALSVGTIASLC